MFNSELPIPPGFLLLWYMRICRPSIYNWTLYQWLISTALLGIVIIKVELRNVS